MAHSFLTILLPSAIAFVITFIAVRFLMWYMTECGVTTRDINKAKKPIVPSSLGLATAFGFAVGMLVYIFGSSFNFYVPVASLDYLFATVLAVLLVSFVGFLDDVNVKAKAKRTTGMVDTRVGLKQWQKPLLTLMGAIPLMAINAGTAVIAIPFVGMVNFGILYPLLIVPLAIIFGANSFNLLGGFNGIQTGMALVATFGMFLYALMSNAYTGLLLSSILLSALLAMFVFDFYPSRMYGGDSFSYFAGTALVAIMVVGNMESFGVIIFIPWIVEFFLHLRRRFDVTDLGTLQRDGTMKPPYGRRIYSWTHIAMNIRRMKEWQVSVFMFSVEALFVVLAFGLKFLALI